MMDLQLFDLLNKYAFFDNLIQAINTLASLQGFVIVIKKDIKVRKKKS